MAFWRAPWDSIFARPSATYSDDDFLLIDGADATSEFGIQSLPSHAFEPLFHRDSTHVRSLSIHSCPTADQLRNARYHTALDFRLGADNEQQLDSTIARRDANALENAGRSTNAHDFQDLRSAAKSQRRRRIDAEKYYGYRAVKRGQLGTPHKIEPNVPFAKRGLPADWPVQLVSKRDLYEQAQLYPKPPTYSRRYAHKDRWPWSMKFEARQAARKHAHSSLDFVDRYIDDRYLTFDIPFPELDEEIAREEWLDDQRQAYHEAQAETLRKQQRETFLIKHDRRSLPQRQRLKQAT